jgi:hypothetical protein
MISPLSLRATSIPSVLLPEAVGPTMAMTGFSEGTRKYNYPDKRKHKQTADDLIT